MKKKKITKQEPIYRRICSIIEEARGRALYVINTEMVRAYWFIGKEIVEEDQKGKKRAGYGGKLIGNLSQRLTADFGKGFTETNLKYMRQFYLVYPQLFIAGKSHAVRGELQKGHPPRDLLTWTHYRLLLKVDNSEARSFYEIEAVQNRWCDILCPRVKRKYLPLNTNSTYPVRKNL